MKKQIAAVIALWCCVIGMSACGVSAVEKPKKQNPKEQSVMVNEMAETHVTEKTPSCETPPKVLVWSKKTYYLKETHSSAEPGTHFGYMKCENGSYTQSISDTAVVNVYSAGPSKDLLYYGRWGGKQGFALYTLKEETDQVLKEEDVASLQVFGGLPGMKHSPLFQRTDTTGKATIAKIVGWINVSKPAPGQTNYGKHGYPMEVTIKMNDGKIVSVEPAYDCVSKTNADGITAKTCTPVKNEIVLSSDSNNIRAESPELYQWLTEGWKKDR